MTGSPPRLGPRSPLSPQAAGATQPASVAAAAPRSQTPAPVLPGSAPSVRVSASAGNKRPRAALPEPHDLPNLADADFDTLLALGNDLLGSPGDQFFDDFMCAGEETFGQHTNEAETALAADASALRRVQLPFADQKLYIEVLCAEGFSPTVRSRALSCMQTYHEHLGFSLTEALCHSDFGHTLAERCALADNAYQGVTATALHGLEEMVKALLAGQAQALPATAANATGGAVVPGNTLPVRRDAASHPLPAVPAGEAASALRRVPSADLKQALLANADRPVLTNSQMSKATIGFEEMRRDASERQSSVTKQVHDALVAKLGKINPGLSPEHRAQMVVAIVRSAIDKLGAPQVRAVTTAKSLVAEVYARQAKLIPAGLQFALLNGAQLSKVGHLVVELPHQDQALYMEVLCAKDVANNVRADALSCMQAYHVATSRSLVEDLRNPGNGNTPEERSAFVCKEYRDSTARSLADLYAVVNAVSAGQAQPLPATPASA